jgi:thioredoxin 1
MRPALFSTLVMLLTSFTMLSAAPIATKVKFHQGDWNLALNKAKSEKKLFYVDFDASYCASCRNMDQTTYQDATLAAFMDQSVVAYRLDVQSIEGIMWSQKYEVEALPTMLIFNAEGKLVKKLVGYKSAKDLMGAFKEAQNPKPTNQVLVKNVNQSDVKPVAQTVKLENKATVETNSTRTNVNPAIVGKSLAYSVQLGVFNSQEILVEQSRMISKKFTKQRTFVLKGTVEGKKVYKLMIGNFSNKSEAISYKDALKAAGHEGLVKDLAVK